ncbi:MAG: ImmA/IrrE family metallo-endopeptidase [Clostridia bacterium]|nr:ImmA/IrrE family metallo-endopeptidase [Clostridia bacterium]
MNYKDYQKSRDLAWEILHREKICALPVNVLEICKHLGMKVLENAELDPKVGDGLGCILGGVPYVFIRPGQSRQRLRFTVAHELGHILLGHVGKYKLVNREPSPQDDPVEQAANGFAARLLAPACVLWGCRVSSAAEIAALCDISPTAARYRWERMQILLERGKFLQSPLERKVYRQFKGYIKEYLKR